MPKVEPKFEKKNLYEIVGSFAIWKFQIEIDNWNKPKPYDNGWIFELIESHFIFGHLNRI